MWQALNVSHFYDYYFFAKSVPMNIISGFVVFSVRDGPLVHDLPFAGGKTRCVNEIKEADKACYLYGVKVYVWDAKTRAERRRALPVNCPQWRCQSSQMGKPKLSQILEGFQDCMLQYIKMFVKNEKAVQYFFIKMKTHKHNTFIDIHKSKAAGTGEIFARCKGTGDNWLLVY